MDRSTIDDDDIQSQYYKAKESLHVQAFSDDYNATATIRNESQHSHPNAIANLNSSNHPESFHIGNAIDEEGHEHHSAIGTWKEKAWHIYEKESLLILVSLAILLAFIYPKLGAIYTLPDITAHWIAVILIFCKYCIPMVHMI